MKAQRGKIILLCLCLIFAMLIISGKASKLGTYLYVRCNYTHLEEFAAEVIQTGAIPDDRYKRRDVRYYPECGMIEFSTFSSGFGSETVYEGFYYSDEDVPCGFQGTCMSFQFDGAVGAGMNPMEITSSTRKKSSGNGTGIVCIFEKQDYIENMSG